MTGSPIETARLSYDYLAAVNALRNDDRERAVDLLAGPSTLSDYDAGRHLFAMFAVAAVITGQMVRALCEDPDDPSPETKHAVLEIYDTTGLRAHPDDLPTGQRLTVWALTAGANLDIESVTAHLANLYRHGGDNALCDGLFRLTTLGASLADEALPS